VTLGALLRLAWACSLRGWMIQLAGPDSNLSWNGTFAALRLPGALVGALFGWAEHLRRTGRRRGWRWLALARCCSRSAPCPCRARSTRW
jgi:hypothetical protein